MSTLMRANHFLRLHSFAAAGRVAPCSLLEDILSQHTQGLGMGICLHRVNKTRRPTDPLPAITVHPDVLDEFIERMTKCRAGTNTPVLTLGFDDGYADAAEYIASRAPRYPGVEWLLFVCPEKLVKRTGYRWDLFETMRQEGKNPPPLADFTLGLGDPNTENDDTGLKSIAQNANYALTTVERCRALAQLPNVKLGNHTNAHLNLSKLPLEVAQRELAASNRDFEALFGRCEHFAFSFGGPQVHWQPEHAQYLRTLGDFSIWSTEQRPHHPRERSSGKVLPRLVYDGRWSAKHMMLWVAWRTFKSRHLAATTATAATLL